MYKNVLGKELYQKKITLNTPKIGFFWFLLQFLTFFLIFLDIFVIFRSSAR